MSGSTDVATSGTGAGLAGEELAERIARIALDKKATDVRVLDVREVVSYTDYLVICTGNTDRQTRAIHAAIHKELKDEAGLLPRRAEGEREARWILLDYLDCVAPRLHAGRARLLPPRAALGRGRLALGRVAVPPERGETEWS